MNGNGNGQAAASGGLIEQTFAWVMHPLNAPYSDPINWTGFFVLAFLAGLFWSKEIRQVLEAI